MGGGDRHRYAAIPDAEPATAGGAGRPRRRLRPPVPPGGGVTGWGTSERGLDSGGVESRQRVLVPDPVVEASEAGARILGVTYWRTIDRFTRGGVRATWSGGGGKLRLLGGGKLPTLRPPPPPFHR